MQNLYPKYLPSLKITLWVAFRVEAEYQTRRGLVMVVQVFFQSNAHAT